MMKIIFLLSDNICYHQMRSDIDLLLEFEECLYSLKK